MVNLVVVKVNFQSELNILVPFYVTNLVKTYHYHYYLFLTTSEHNLWQNSEVCIILLWQTCG